MTKKDVVSYKELYELLDRRTHEIYKVVDDLRTSFDSLEKGRLTLVETGLAQTRISLESLRSNVEGRGEGMNKTIVYLGIGVSIIVSIVGLFLKIK